MKKELVRIIKTQLMIVACAPDMEWIEVDEIDCSTGCYIGNRMRFYKEVYLGD